MRLATPPHRYQAAGVVDDRASAISGKTRAQWDVDLDLRSANLSSTGRARLFLGIPLSYCGHVVNPKIVLSGGSSNSGFTID